MDCRLLTVESSGNLQGHLIVTAADSQTLSQEGLLQQASQRISEVSELCEVRTATPLYSGVSLYRSSVYRFQAIPVGNGQISSARTVKCPANGILCTGFTLYRSISAVYSVTGIERLHCMCRAAL